MRREGNQLVIDLPEGLDPNLSYRIEFEKANIAKVKLVQRPKHPLAKSSAHLESLNDDPSREVPKASLAD